VTTGVRVPMLFSTFVR